MRINMVITTLTAKNQESAFEKKRRQLAAFTGSLRCTATAPAGGTKAGSGKEMRHGDIPAKKKAIQPGAILWVSRREGADDADWLRQEEVLSGIEEFLREQEGEGKTVTLFYGDYEGLYLGSLVAGRLGKTCYTDVIGWRTTGGGTLRRFRSGAFHGGTGKCKEHPGGEYGQTRAGVFLCGLWDGDRRRHSGGRPAFR